MKKSFALALGGGGARGLAHIAVLEALDEIGSKPAAIAATSIGALIAAAYAAGMSGRQIRRFVITLAHDRSEVFRRLIASRASTFANLFNIGLGSATLLDAEKFCRQFLPEQVPEQFGELYGAEDSEIAAVSAWLQKHGFAIARVTKGVDAVVVPDFLNGQTLHSAGGLRLRPAAGRLFTGENRQVLRPSVFARYNATSAFFSSFSSVVPSPGAIEIPMLQPMTIRCPSIS